MVLCPWFAIRRSWRSGCLGRAFGQSRGKHEKHSGSGIRRVGVALVPLRFCYHSENCRLLARSCSTKRCLILLHKEEREIPTVIQREQGKKNIRSDNFLPSELVGFCNSSLSDPSAEHINVCSSFPYKMLGVFNAMCTLSVPTKTSITLQFFQFSIYFWLMLKL